MLDANQTADDRARQTHCASSSKRCISSSILPRSSLCFVHACPPYAVSSSRFVMLEDARKCVTRWACHRGRGGSKACSQREGSACAPVALVLKLGTCILDTLAPRLGVLAVRATGLRHVVSSGGRGRIENLCVLRTASAVHAVVFFFFSALASCVLGGRIPSAAQGDALGGVKDEFLAPFDALHLRDHERRALRRREGEGVRVRGAKVAWKGFGGKRRWRGELG